MKHSPILADRLAANTTKGISSIAAEIISVVFNQSHRSPSVSTPSLTRRLVELIEKGPISQEIAEFLTYHHKILVTAFGYADVGQLVFDAQEGYVFFGGRRYTPMTIGTYGLAFSNAKGPVFENGSPTGSLQSMIERIKTSDLGKLAFQNQYEWETEYLYTTILAGRRNDYSDLERKYLQELNKAYEEDLIKIRSYDWIIDACLKVDNS